MLTPTLSPASDDFGQCWLYIARSGSLLQVTAQKDHGHLCTIAADANIFQFFWVGSEIIWGISPSSFGYTS